MPLDALDIAFVALEIAELFLQVTDIKEFDFLVLGPSEEEVAVDWIPFGLLNGWVVHLELEDRLAWIIARVPD